MDIQHQNDRDLDQVAALIKEIRFGMLVTEEADGTLRSRPMTTLQMDADGCLWFFTGLDSAKLAEEQQHREVNISYARPDKQDYLSVSGSASVVRDREKMKSLWTAWIKPWFPQGLDDPNLVLLKVRIGEAEYWKAPGTAPMRLYGLAKGVVTGNTDALGENRSVRR